MKYIPGPWGVEITGGQAKIREVNGTGAGGYQCEICRIGDRDYYLSDRDRANVRAIVALPDLLNAVRAVAQDLYISDPQPTKEHLRNLWQLCRKALEKAEGEK